MDSDFGAASTWDDCGETGPSTVRYARVAGVSLAYQTWGTGPATIVAIPPLAQNIELTWERPEYRMMLERLGSFARVLHFDKRGTGASDRTAHMPTMDERVEDLRAVMHDAGIQRAHLLGVSEGGPMALALAATYTDHRGRPGVACNWCRRVRMAAHAVGRRARPGRRRASGR